MTYWQESVLHMVTYVRTLMIYVGKKNDGCCVEICL